MKFPSYPDIHYPEKCYKELGESNLDEYYKQCELNFEKSFEQFIMELKGKKLIELDLSLLEVQEVVKFLQTGFMYLSNALLQQEEDLVVSSTSIEKSHNLLESPTRQLFVDLIGQLDNIRKIYYQKYLKEYLESINDKIMENIRACDDILIGNSTKILKAKFARSLAMKNYDEIVEKMNILDYYISNLIDVTDIQHEKDETINYLRKLGFTQVIDRISIAKDYL